MIGLGISSNEGNRDRKKVKYKARGELVKWLGETKYDVQFHLTFEKKLSEGKVNEYIQKLFLDFYLIGDGSVIFEELTSEGNTHFHMLVKINPKKKRKRFIKSIYRIAEHYIYDNTDDRMLWYQTKEYYKDELQWIRK